MQFKTKSGLVDIPNDEVLAAAATMRDDSYVRDGNWLDKWGCCRVCDGEIPHGHTDNCDIFKMEKKERVLRDALGGLVDAVNVEFPSGMRDIGGKTGVALIRAVDALATKLDTAAVIEAQKHNHEKPLQLD